MLEEGEAIIRYFLSSVYENAEYIYNICVNHLINKE